MAKKKKTRLEKRLADLRRQVQLSQNAVVSAAPSSPAEIAQPKIQTEIVLPKISIPFTPSQSSYTHLALLKHDIRKTTLLTLSLIALQIALFFMLRFHIVKVPGLLY
ncbi:MAG TPA: hypothetical protein VLF68_03880 [Candidatus Saccharimonadales bacterium]|nr:hypothetical protein [Candidatus Saccharimonadales bacterium]